VPTPAITSISPSPLYAGATATVFGTDLPLTIDTVRASVAPPDYDPTPAEPDAAGTVHPMFVLAGIPVTWVGGHPTFVVPATTRTTGVLVVSLNATGGTHDIKWDTPVAPDFVVPFVVPPSGAGTAPGVTPPPASATVNGVIYDPSWNLLTNPAPSPAAFVTVIDPWPVYSGLLCTAGGPNVGVCTDILITTVKTVNAVTTQRTLSAPLTRLNQNSASFTLPDFGVEAFTTAAAQVRYTVDGAVHLSYPLPLVLVAPPAATGPPATAVTPTYGYNIPTGGYWGPLAMQRWQFHDPSDPDPVTNTWTVPINPREMSSVFPTRAFTQKHSTAVDGQLLLFEGPPAPVDFTFAGAILDANHYDMLRSWTYERHTAIEIRDHFGRTLLVVMTKFDVKPKNARGVYWRHEYSIEALLLDISPPTLIPA
jgi:hypothetical protein